MQFYSTNNKDLRVDLATAVLSGLAPDNGLYMPCELTPLPKEFFDTLATRSFQENSYLIARQILGDSIPEKNLREIVSDTLSFEAPLVRISDHISALELFHGPTMAFKDFGARFMARVMSYFLKDSDQRLTILVATSGDTGSAVAHGFLNLPKIDVVILYPQGKVSPLQEKQLTTMGSNITALEINGTFDDCQSLVKQAFLDQELQGKRPLSSANSINIARLIPQSFYYVQAYSQARAQSDLPVVFSVPSGNFGNLTAGLLAYKLGLPVEYFVAATNLNKIVPEYLAGSAYNPRASIQTISNAMDVGNPSNFVRLQEIFGGSLESFKAIVRGHYFTDEQTIACMQKIYQETGYILDPHGAVAYLGLLEFKQQHRPLINGIFLETAHPAKFKEVVDSALNLELPLPERLAEYNRREKVSIPMSVDYQALKSYLVNS